MSKEKELDEILMNNTPPVPTVSEGEIVRIIGRYSKEPQYDKRMVDDLLALLNGEKEVELCDHPESCHICAERMLKKG